MPSELTNGIERIQADVTSGSAALAEAAARLLEYLAEDAPAPADAEFTHVITDACRRMVLAQPAMAAMVNLANLVLWNMDKPEYAADRREAVRSAVRAFVESSRQSGERISVHFASLLSKTSTILTHSNSRTVSDSLIAAWKADLRIHVICTESRPLCEGVALARVLAEAGIPVTLIPDGAMYSAMGGVDLALAGADSVSTHGLVNKTGTALLALAARERGVKFQVLCGEMKFLPEGYVPPPQAQRPASELMDVRNAKVDVDNRYFELTPLEWIDSVITEHGPLKGQQLSLRLGRDKLHPSLTGLR